MTTIILTDLENQVLTELCHQLADWRDGEPGYSCIDGSDITKALNLKPKTVSGVISSLCKKGLVYSDDGGDWNGILYAQWDKIPNDYARELKEKEAEAEAEYQYFKSHPELNP